MAQSLNKPSKELVLDLINEANDYNLTTDHVLFGFPQVAAEGAVRNTTVEVLPTDSLPTMKAPVVVQYNRLDIQRICAMYTLEMEGDDSTTFNDIIAEINYRFNLGLTSEDLVAGNIPTGSWPKTVEFRAHARSLVYYGGFNIVLNRRDTGPDPTTIIQTEEDQPVLTEEDQYITLEE